MLGRPGATTVRALVSARIDGPFRRSDDRRQLPRIRRWLSLDLGSDAGNDFHEFIMERGDRESGVIRMPRLREGELQRLKGSLQKPVFPEERLEPPVRLTRVGRDDFVAPESFDFIFLARSPAFTPKEADPIYAEIRRRFIDEKAWSDLLEPDDSC